MEKPIEIDLDSQDDFVEKYDKNKVSNELLDYIINQITHINKKEQIKIIINKKAMLKQDCSKMIKEGLKEEYSRNLQQLHDNNVKQILLLFLGATFLFLSTLIDKGIIWKEILLISGWVPIWEMIELELFSDVKSNKKRQIINKLLKSEITENIIEKKILQI